MQAILPPYQPVVVRQSQGSAKYSQQSCCTILLCRTQATLLLVCGLNRLATLTPSATSRINYHVLANRPQSSTHAINSYLATTFLVISDSSLPRVCSPTTHSSSTSHAHAEGSQLSTSSTLTATASLPPEVYAQSRSVCRASPAPSSPFWSLFLAVGALFFRA